MGLANFSPAPMNLSSSRPVWMRTTRSSILCLISKVQKELNENEVWGPGWGGEAVAGRSWGMVFLPGTFKETGKRLHHLFHLDSWPGGSPLIQNYPCTILACGWAEGGARTVMWSQRQVTSAQCCPWALCPGLSVSRPTKTATVQTRPLLLTEA